MKRYFPQLSTGTLAQFPLTRTLERRSVVNRLADGSTVRLFDPDASLVRWELRYSGLSDAERSGLETFFRESEGRLHDFVFLDPCANLLFRSDDLTDDVWKTGTITFESGEGGVLRLTNPAQTEQSLEQTITLPGWFCYCFSAQLRSDEVSQVRLFIDAEGERRYSSAAVTPDWTETFVSAAVGTETEEISCGIEVPAGRLIEVRSLLLQAQPGPGAYRRSTTHNGVFEKTRFDTDSLEFQANGADDHSVVIRLVSRTQS